MAWVSTMGLWGVGHRLLTTSERSIPPPFNCRTISPGERFFGSRRAWGRCALARTGYIHLQHTGSSLNRGNAVLPPAQGTGPSRAPGKHEPSKLRQVHCAHGWHTPEYPGETRDRPPNSFENDGIHATNGGNTMHPNEPRTQPNAPERTRTRDPRSVRAGHWRAVAGLRPSHRFDRRSPELHRVARRRNLADPAAVRDRLRNAAADGKDDVEVVLLQGPPDLSVALGANLQVFLTSCRFCQLGFVVNPLQMERGSKR